MARDPRQRKAHEMLEHVESFEWAGDLAEPDLLAVTHIWNAVWAEWIPGEPAMAPEAYVDHDRFTAPPEHIERARSGCSRNRRRGLSEMYLWERNPWLALQGDTGVAPAHRGHGLGAWMKAANHLRLREERPEVTVVQTWNASANEPMLRINRALGFRPVQTYRGWYLRLD